MEKYKLLYLQRFLKRKNGLDVESCITEIDKVKYEALKCYDDNLDGDIVDNFSEMLLVDGCFVVEFIREDYEKDDDIIKLERMKNQVSRDMVLLENQLPFFVLVILYGMTVHPTEENFLYMVRENLYLNQKLKVYQNNSTIYLMWYTCFVAHQLNKTWTLARKTSVPR